MPLDLVIQGPALHEGHIETLRALARPSSVEAAPGTARLRSVQSQDGVAAYCEQVGVDFAFVDASKRLADFRLLAMDMDSTLISIECIDEIADIQGIKPQVAAITAAAMRGEIDFAESLRRRVALLAGLDESALQRVYDERLRLSQGAERMLEALKRHGVKTLLVSGGFDFFTGRLKARLGLDYTLSNTLEIEGGKLTGRVQGRIVDAAVKATRSSASWASRPIKSSRSATARTTCR
jgi:phosphoserine phosphatase